MQRTRIAIFEDNNDLRDSLAMIIESVPAFELTGSFSNAQRLDMKMKESRPDVVLMDINMPGMTGIDAVIQIHEHYPDTKIVMQTVFEDDDKVFASLCAGASGYLLKKTPPARLIECLREAMNGGAPMSPEVASRVVSLFRTIRPPAKADYQLTPHEVRLLKLLVEGHSHKTAAAELRSSVNTIGFHMRNIYRKLQVHSKSEAVVKALRHGLV